MAEAYTIADSGSRALLIQFARAPVEGRVKTRMIPHLTPRQACDLHRDLVRWVCARLLSSGLGEVELAVAGDTADPLFAECRVMGVSEVSHQEGRDLGERMYLSIERGLRHSDKVILVGSDCPGIDGRYLEKAVAALADAPLVFGPAEDGGYILIGARRIQPEIFTGVSWGSAQVYAQTVAIMRQQGLDWAELPALADVDRPGDLALWRRFRGGD